MKLKKHPISKISLPAYFAALLFSFTFLIFTESHAGEADANEKPNIIFILADDLGIDGLSCYGGDNFNTPRLDKLAETGVRFTNVYTVPVCGPSRAQLITGQYPFRSGAIEIDPTMKEASPETCPSLPRVMKSAGYVTGMSGKWKQMRYEPNEWGFDEVLMSPTANGYYRAKSWMVNGEEITADEERYFPEVMNEFALSFIEKHKNEPFFFYYPLTTPHTPILPTPFTEPGEENVHELYEDNIDYIDYVTGTVVDKLEELGIRENTIIIFSGDNGTMKSVQGTVNGKELVGGKISMREGGSHVPLVVNWPAKIKSKQVCKDLVDFSDMLPTLAAIGGAELPDDKGKIDGRSFLPQLLGEEGNPREWIFVQMGHYYYARNKNWRLDEMGRLYDMSKAPFEEKLVENENYPGAEEARKELNAVLEELDPKSGKTYDQWKGFTYKGVVHRAPGHKRPDFK